MKINKGSFKAFNLALESLTDWEYMRKSHVGDVLIASFMKHSDVEKDGVFSIHTSLEYYGVRISVNHTEIIVTSVKELHNIEELLTEVFHHFKQYQ